MFMQWRAAPGSMIPMTAAANSISTWAVGVDKSRTLSLGRALTRFFLQSVRNAHQEVKGDCLEVC
jgi:hypothetical protein